MMRKRGLGNKAETSKAATNEASKSSNRVSNKDYVNP
ncbi:hypothetical protein Xekk_02508 [Xenorhabdus sp. KK7.4]|nr:hypothetical protein Xekk_02508 [Xenorhabdus sp. KK7.4]